MAFRVYVDLSYSSLILHLFLSSSVWEYNDMLVELTFISWFLIKLERIMYEIKDCIFKFSSLRDFSTVYRIKWTKSVADPRNPHFRPPQEAHRSVEDCLWRFLGITGFKRHTLETRANARSATVGVGGSTLLVTPLGNRKMAKLVYSIDGSPSYVGYGQHAKLSEGFS